MERPVLISNADVLELLRKQISNHPEKDSMKQEDVVDAEGNHNNNNPNTNTMEHRDWIQEKVVEYLDSTPCMRFGDKSNRTELRSKLMSQKRKKKSVTKPAPTPTGNDDMDDAVNDEVKAEEAQEATGFGLTEAESMQILNSAPTEMVELHLMVEELHSRLPENEQERMLELIASYMVNENGAEGENLEQDEEYGVEEEAVEEEYEDDAETTHIKQEEPEDMNANF